jgi:hypothetical protein
MASAPRLLLMTCSLAARKDSMAGSLNHIIDDDGSFTFELIENMGDAHEACEECFDIIAALLDMIPNPTNALHIACEQANAPRPNALPILGKRKNA